jgi:ATP-dependent Clp protease, protease subunit
MTNPISQEAYALFAGLIDQQAVQRIFQGVAGATANKIKKVHLLFQSTGGTVGDGVALYNFFRTLPVELCLYNVGSVASIAAIAYLGANVRKTSAYATFMVHRTQAPMQAATAERLQAIAHSVTIDDQRTDAILRKHLKMPDDRWEVHQVADLWMNAGEAVKFGMATEIGEFAPPIGTQIFTV